jgi:mannose-6-phosphate isomerase-like protein (cupin superfamily)
MYDRPKHVEQVPEEPHPFLRGVSMRTLLSRRDDGADATCLLVRCQEGSEIEEHVHEEQDDIIYVLEGEATMWIEGTGEFPLTPGTFVAVSRGRHHRTYDVRKGLLIYDTFTPPMF